MSAIETAIAALYLRGLARPAEPHPRAWPQVLSLLRKQAPESWSAELRASGFQAEALCLEGAVWPQANRLVQSALVLTVASPYYPKRWVERLGPACPPALYARGPLELLLNPTLGLVGSRRPPAYLLQFAKQLSAVAASQGLAMVSGGAPGIDRVVAAASQVIEIWPCGLGCHWGARHSAGQERLTLSMWPPREPFSAAGAMERNGLVYALSEAVFVGHARFKQGGSWHGATDAVRRRLTRLLVTTRPWDAEGEPARRAFIALGAAQLEEATPQSLSGALEAAPMQPWLPGFAPSPEADYARTVW